MQVFRRRRANEDINSALDFYLHEAGADVANRFVDQLDATTKKIARQPNTGSLRYAHELQISGLMFRLMESFPYLVFFLVREERVEIVRVLQERMDILAQFDDEEI